VLKNRVPSVPNRRRLENVLISLSDKEGIEGFATALLEISPKVTFYSTGGTYKRLREILPEKNLVELATYTGQPEMQGGLVKSLDFHVHAGILAESGNQEHRRYLDQIGAVEFDMVVVNLYPFAKTVESMDSDLEDARGNIDIGGPTMLRAGAKNFLRVAAVTNPDRYDTLLKELRENDGALSLQTRFELARETFAHTRAYEEAISSYLDQLSPQAPANTYEITKE